jgi:hypothetical protein
MEDKERSSSVNDSNGGRNGGRRTLPAIFLPVVTKNCPKCAHVTKSGPIHSTLAYSRCRCHRSWKYSMPEDALDVIADRDKPLSSAVNGAGHSSTTTTSCSSSSYSTGGMKQYGMKGTITGGPKRGLIKKYCMIKRQPHLPPLNHAAAGGGPTADLSQTIINGGAHHPLMRTHRITNNAHGPVTSQLSIRQSPSPRDKDCTIVSNGLSIHPMHHHHHNDGNSINTSTYKLLTNSNSSMTSSPSLSSIPTLPQIQSTSLLHTIPEIPLNDNNDDENDPKIKKQNSSTATFEFVHLLKYISNQHKLEGSELFDILDKNDDGHLTFSEVYLGLTNTWRDTLNKTKFELYLKPLYHVLGDDTYFGKRDFILCYSLAQIFREYSFIVSQFSFSAGTQFYHNIIKPLMVDLINDCSSDSTISLVSIEDGVRKFNNKNITGRLTFNSNIATKVQCHYCL